MQSKATTVEAYLAEVPEDRRPYLLRLRQIILENLPDGFEEQMSYGMIGYVVPHSRYPQGYHCDPSLPLPFVNLANQKQYIALYHSGLYASPDLLNWFISEYPKHSSQKLDMGKSCIRFRNMDSIPYAFIGELMRKMTVDEWIALYESQVKGRRRQKTP